MTEDQLESYVKYLIDNGYAAEKCEERIKLNVNIEGFDLILWCDIYKYFPYQIPEVFIDKESKKEMPKIPHLHTDGSICIFDEDKVIPNINNPEGLLKTTIDTAILVIKDGIQGNNQYDFIDEFLEYWSNKGIIESQIFIEKMEEFKTIYWGFKKDNIIIADSENRLEEISNAIVGKDITKTKKGILIPVIGKNMRSIPKNNVDIIDLIEKYSLYQAKFNSFMQKNLGNSTLVVLNIILPEGNMLVGWVLPGVKEITGFRKGHVDLRVAFYKTKESGMALSVENCHQNRLYLRGGDGKKKTWDSVAVIGCGSVGSFVIDSLKYYGTERFVLNDNESVQYENIARHSEGYFSVGLSKVSAIKFSLENHNPNIVCQTNIKNAHEFIEEETELINSCEVIFVAVASTSVEYHVNKLMTEKVISKPIIYIWVEPHLMAGHALLIKDNQNIYSEIFDPNSFEYRYSVVNNGYDLYKREAGCQSSYIQYSGFNLQQFVSRILESILSQCWKQKGNYLLTWIGKISDAEKYGVILNEEYLGREDYSIIRRRID